MIPLLQRIAAPALYHACQQLPVLGVRSMSGSAVVDQMLGYVWKDLQASAYLQHTISGLYDTQGST
jgi:hypothetical protein